MSRQVLTREQLAELAALETTPGPWFADMESPIAAIVRAESLDGPKLAEVDERPRYAADARLFAAAQDLLATALDRDLRILDLERRLDLRESALSDAGADLHALTEEARELGTDAHPDDLRAFVSRLVDVYAGAAGRAVVVERDALRAEVAKLRAALASQQVPQAPVGRDMIGPGRVRASVLAALAKVHMELPEWAGAVADDVLARLQASEPRREWVVQLEPGVWLAPWEGDPGRTCERSSAQRFGSERAALRALEQARRFRALPVAVVEVA